MNRNRLDQSQSSWTKQKWTNTLPSISTDTQQKVIHVFFHMLLLGLFFCFVLMFIWYLCGNSISQHPPGLWGMCWFSDLSHFIHFACGEIIVTLTLMNLKNDNWLGKWLTGFLLEVLNNKTVGCFGCWPNPGQCLMGTQVQLSTTKLFVDTSLILDAF